jgi:hypothetical protein
MFTKEPSTLEVLPLAFTAVVIMLSPTKQVIVKNLLFIRFVIFDN